MRSQRYSVVALSLQPIDFVNASDTVSATFGGSFRVTFSESVSVIADKILYIIGSEDEAYILGSEDEQYQIESEE